MTVQEEDGGDVVDDEGKGKDDGRKGRLVENYEACSLAPIFAEIVGMLEANEGALPEFRPEAA